MLDLNGPILQLRFKALRRPRRLSMSGIGRKTSVHCIEDRMMARTQAKTWLITGCSSGFGRLLGEAALARGDNVMLTARDPQKLHALANQYPETAVAMPLDVTREGDAAAVVREIEKRFGRLDVLVNNAGYGLIGAVEEVTPDEYRALFETNVFGLIETTRAALPLLRTQSGGRIIQFSSTLGICGRAGFGLYSASKFAVEGLSEALAAELQPLGVSVVIVEPGAFRTDFLGRSITVANNRIAAYETTSGVVRDSALQNDGQQPGDPHRAVAVLMSVVDTENPPLRLALGQDSYRNNRGKIARVIADYGEWERIAADTDYLG
jgi:NAD(P)-dependent dehydrogenase (short-subunit alcohol dehydrogenase family)